MKKLFITGSILISSVFVMAQKQYIPPTYSSNNDNKDFNKDNLFVGGSLALGLSNYTFNIGATPEIGYSFNNWFDAGVAVNLNYQSVRADPNYNNTRQRIFNYGGGPFFRVYPLQQFFIEGQFEHNWINYNDLYYGYTPPVASTSKTQASSFLAGIGFTQRIVGQSSFYTVIMIDLMTDQNSPYRDYYGNAIPIVRAGFNFYLHRKKK